MLTKDETLLTDGRAHTYAFFDIPNTSIVDAMMEPGSSAHKKTAAVVHQTASDIGQRLDDRDDLRAKLDFQTRRAEHAEKRLEERPAVLGGLAKVIGDADSFAKVIAEEAARQENEACARVCESLPRPTHGSFDRGDFAAAIRARAAEHYADLPVFVESGRDA